MVAFTPTVLVVLAIVPIALALAAVAWRRRNEPAGKPVVFYLLALAAGTTTYGLELGTADLRTKFLLVGISLVLMSLFTGAWVWVALAYTGRSRFTNRRTAALLAVEPVLVATAVALPPLRSTIYELPASGGVGSMGSIGGEAGLVLVSHFVYQLALMFVATVLFVGLFVRSRHLYRVQATALLAAALAPWLAIIVPTFDLFTAFDVSVFAWLLAGVAITVALFRVKVLDPVPAAHASIVEEMGDGVLVLDAEDRVGDFNPEATRLLGVDTERIGAPIADVFERWESLDRDDPDAWHETAIEREGTRRYLEVQVSPFFDHHDRRIGRLLVLRDVTERKRREETLARYKTVFESIQDRVFVLDDAGRFVLANDPLGALLGIDTDTLLGKHLSAVVADDDLELTPEAGARSGDRDGSENYESPVEVTIETLAGEAIPCEMRLAPVSLRDVEGTVGVVRDIRRRKRVERSLRETTERFETLVAASPLAIVAIDSAGVVEAWNPAAEELFGWSAEAVVGERLPVIPTEHRDELRERHERVLAGERITGVETSLCRKDGSRVEVGLSIAPVHDDGGEVNGSVSVIADITDRIERERRLRRQNERLEEFAGVVSHDLRNPLGVASGWFPVAVETGKDEHAERVERALTRMDELVDDLLVLAREGEAIGETEPVDFERVLRRAWESVGTDAATLDVLPGVPETVESDRSRLTELFENLCRNAIEHGGEGVTVTVGATQAGFFIADDGPGIPDGERGAVFESGYSTTADGTGFGLAIVSRIAEAHGWTVTATESESGGARFEFAGVAGSDPDSPELSATDEPPGNG
jgi:PAS domain S-box-containing protein